MADWNEIKRLAADFQRAQLSSTVQRLSERNCIEIVQTLLSHKQIDVIYTIDGKEYLTHQELKKEINEERQVQGGRVNLVNLSKTLNVDLSHIEVKAAEIVNEDPHVRLVLGQLIDRTYEKQLAEAVNDKLLDQGKVTFGELITTYDLPRDFFVELLSEYLGNVIQGYIDDTDKNIIFTTTYVSKYRSVIRGAFSAVTRPVQLSILMNALDLHGNLFFSILEELIKTGRLAGSLSGGRQANATYVPEIYTKAQAKWVDDFYKQNGYLEYDALTRLGLNDSKGYIKKNLKGETLTFLSSCCVGAAIQERIQAEIDEALTTSGWINVMPFLPTILSAKDGNQLLQGCLKKKSDALILCDTIVISNKFLASCRSSFDQLMATKAEQDAKNNPALWATDSDKKLKGIMAEDSREDKKDSRKKKGGKSGGGTQGREVKTKAVKKKYMKGRDRDDDSDDDSGTAGASGGSGKQMELEFLSIEEIASHLETKDFMMECSDDMATALALELYRPMKKQYQDVARSVFLQTVGAATGSGRKEVHGELQEKLIGLWTNVKLFEKGIKLFPDDVQQQLQKHLLKTLCTDITNLVFTALAKDEMMAMTKKKKVPTATLR